MGKFANYATGFIVGLAIAIIVFVCFQASTGGIKLMPQGSDNENAELIMGDSIQSNVSPSNILEKTYKSVTDVSMDHQELVSELLCVEAYKDIPDETVQNVATLLLRTRPTITISDIVHEYQANKKIYDNIIPNAISDQNSDPGPAIKSDQQITKELSSYQQTARDSVPNVRIVERKQ